MSLRGTKIHTTGWPRSYPEKGLNTPSTRHKCNIGVSVPLCSDLRDQDCSRDHVTDKTSSVGSLTPQRELSPSFHKRLLHLQDELQQRQLDDEKEHSEYIRALESCLGEPSDSVSPFSGSTACSAEGGAMKQYHSICGTNIIVLDNSRNNVRLEVALHKLRPGITGQQKLIRLHQTNTYLELEYSDAIEDLELSYSPVTENSVPYTPAITYASTHRSLDRTFMSRNDDGTLTWSYLKIPWIWLTTSAISLTAVALYYRSRKTSFI